MSLPIAALRRWILRRNNRHIRASVTYSSLLRYRQFL